VLGGNSISEERSAGQATITNIQAEITALQQANPNLDLSGLQGAVATLNFLLYDYGSEDE
jgi:hypothetical protein